jgi:hypothetical protein
MTANLQNIAAGTYTLSATDLSGCVSTITETITESIALGIQLTPTDIDCNGNVNGSISAVTSGGTGTYTYVWSSGQTVSMIDNLQSGNYTVSITDSLGCTTSDTTTINEPSVLSFIASVFPTTGANGIVDLTVSGGTSAYTFIWSDGSILEKRNDLLVGNYVYKKILRKNYFDVDLNMGEQHPVYNHGLKKNYNTNSAGWGKKRFSFCTDNYGFRNKCNFNENSKNFDIVIAPEHDNLNGENIMNSKGAIHYITYLEINNAKSYLESKIKNKKPK